MAFDYCCSLGLRLAELTTWEDLQIANLGKLRALITISWSDFKLSADKRSPTACIIGETFIDGQQKDVWCNSKIPITDMRLHYGGSQLKEGSESFKKSASCYVEYFSGTDNSNQHGLILNGDTCLMASTKLYYNIFFLCE
jgi:hypothetical protein